MASGSMTSDLNLAGREDDCGSSVVSSRYPSGRSSPLSCSMHHLSLINCVAANVGLEQKTSRITNHNIKLRSKFMMGTAS